MLSIAVNNPRLKCFRFRSNPEWYIVDARFSIMLDSQSFIYSIAISRPPKNGLLLTMRRTEVEQ